MQLMQQINKHKQINMQELFNLLSLVFIKVTILQPITKIINILLYYKTLFCFLKLRYVFVYIPIFSMTFKHIFPEFNLSTDELIERNFVYLIKF